jgi:hypothetical protein
MPIRVSYKAGNFIDYPSNHQLLDNDSIKDLFTVGFLTFSIVS